MEDKQKNTLLVGLVIAIVIFLFLLPIMIIAFARFGEEQGELGDSGVPGLGNSGTTGQITSTVISCIIDKGNGKLNSATVASLQTKQPVYEAGAAQAGIPWDVLAALHMRETGLNASGDNPFQITGYHGTFSANAAATAAKFLVHKGKSVYGVDISKNPSDENIQLAYLAYNRGSSYKSKGLTPNDSPYVFNFYDSAHQNMKWPPGDIGSVGGVSIAGKVDRNLGAFTFLSIMRSCGGTAPPSNIQGTVLPLKQAEMKNTFNSTLHNCSISSPPGCSDGGHRPVLGSLNSLGTNIPTKRSSGEASDVMTIHGATVYAPFSGTITYNGHVSRSDASMGQMLTVQSTDGRMTAALLHLNKSGIIAKKTVKAGEPVGTVITMISSRGNDITHLHFELWIDGKAINAGGPGSGVSGGKVWKAQKHALGY